MALNISLRHTVVSFIIATVAFVANVIQFSLPFLVFSPASATDGAFFYFIALPVYIVPVINIIALILGACLPLAGTLIHAICCILGAGTVVYYVLFLQHKIDQNALQFYVPLIAMSATLVFSAVKAADDMVTFVERKILRKRNSKKKINEYLRVDTYSDSDDEGGRTYA